MTSPEEMFKTQDNEAQFHSILDFLDYGIAEEIKSKTRIINQNFNTWEEGDVYHFYDDLQTMFTSLCDDQSVLSRKQMRLVDAAVTSFDKMFKTKKRGDLVQPVRSANWHDINDEQTILPG